MQAARARRKIIVIGELQTCPAQKGTKYDEDSRTARRKLRTSPSSSGPGPRACSRRASWRGRTRCALSVTSAMRPSIVNSITREGDLILLKGANKQDHLLRIILARTGDIACWRDDCDRYYVLQRVSGSNASLRASRQPLRREPLDTRSLARQRAAPRVGSDEQVIVGLGNPEDQVRRHAAQRRLRGRRPRSLPHWGSRGIRPRRLDRPRFVARAQRVPDQDQDRDERYRHGVEAALRSACRSTLSNAFSCHDESRHAPG